jgi:hypothetical protein
MSLIEQDLKWQSDLLNRISQQGTAVSQPQIEAGHDATSPPSQRKSSVASTDLPEDDDEPAIRYPVDDITESTSCELRTCEGREHNHEGGGRLCLTHWT